MRDFLKKINNEEIYRKLCIVFLIFIIMLVYTGALLWKPVPMGESDDYMLSTVSLQYRGDLAVRQSDLEQAITDFPEFAEYLKTNYDAGLMSTYVDENGGRIPWYFGTYSAICIPVKVVLKHLNLPQVYTYAITNSILFSIALLSVFFILKTSYKIRLILIMLLAINPAVFYLVWQSAEVCIYALVIISLTFFVNKNYKPAALILSIAGTLNSTIMIYGFMLILAYFIDLFKQAKPINWIKVILQKWKDVFLFILSFVPCLIPFIYYFLNFGVWNLQVAYGFAQSGSYFGRFLAYLFDWNLGILPYFSLVFILFVVMIIVSIFQKKIEGLFFATSFFGVIAAFSLMWHINCGMSGIARYNVWVSPFMIFGTVILSTTCIKSISFKRIANTIMLLSVVLSSFIIYKYGVMFAYNTSDIYLTPIAERILNISPSLYYTYPSTFVDRVDHIPGGYEYTSPVLYANNQGYVRKIMVSSDTWGDLLNQIEGDEKTINHIKSFENKVLNDPDFYFINVSKKYRLSIKTEAKLKKINKLSDGILDVTELSTNGIMKQQEGKIVLGSGQIQYGPYIKLPKGMYEIIIYGDKLTSADFHISGQIGTVNIPFEITELADKQTKLVFSLDYDLENTEFLTQNIGLEEVIIDKIELKIIN